MAVNGGKIKLEVEESAVILEYQKDVKEAERVALLKLIQSIWRVCFDSLLLLIHNHFQQTNHFLFFTCLASVFNSSSFSRQSSRRSSASISRSLIFCASFDFFSLISAFSFSNSR